MSRGPDRPINIEDAYDLQIEGILEFVQRYYPESYMDDGPFRRIIVLGKPKKRKKYFLWGPVITIEGAYLGAINVEYVLGQEVKSSAKKWLDGLNDYSLKLTLIKEFGRHGRKGLNIMLEVLEEI